MDEEMAAERKAEEELRAEQEMLKNIEDTKHQQDLVQAQVDDDDDQEEKNSQDEEPQEKDDEMAMKQQRPQPTISNREIREELQAAINEAQRQANEFREQNERLQMRI